MCIAYYEQCVYIPIRIVYIAIEKQLCASSPIQNNSALAQMQGAVVVIVSKETLKYLMLRPYMPIFYKTLFHII